MRSSALIGMLSISLGSVLSSFPYVSSAQQSAIPETENRIDDVLRKITLEQVLHIAAETHPSIAQRRSEQGASDYGVIGARWQRWPGVSMSSSRGPLGSTLTELQLEQPLWTGGRITANINAAEARAEAARHSVLEARKIIIERAINAYAEAMRLQSRIAIADAAIEDFETLTAMIDRRVENGISPKADAVNVRARLQQANSERLQLRLQRRNTLTELELLIGQGFSELAVPQPLRSNPISLEDAVHLALESAPELARLNAEERVAEETIAATRSNLSPSLSLRYQRIFGGGTLYATDQLFLGVTYQPGSGLSSLSAISEAEARRTGTTYAREAIRLELMNRVRNLWQQSDSSRRELMVLRELVASTQEVYASCLRQFPVGRRTWLEVLLARRDATQAQYALSDTQWMGFAAELKLQLVTGELAARNYRINTEVSE
jgi:outer membrane protein, adhesin transport system